MKTLENLSAEVGESQFPARGIVTEMQYEDPQCGGWFIGIALTTSGLRFKSRRPQAGDGLMIPLDELLAIARKHAPEIFADEEAKAAVSAARARQTPARAITTNPAKPNPSKPS